MDVTQVQHSSTIVLFADHIQIIQHSKNCKPGTDDRHKIVGTLLRMELHLSSGNLLLSHSKKNLGISRRNLVDHHFSNENIALICLNVACKQTHTNPTLHLCWVHSSFALPSDSASRTISSSRTCDRHDCELSSRIQSHHPAT